VHGKTGEMKAKNTHKKASTQILARHQKSCPCLPKYKKISKLYYSWGLHPHAPDTEIHEYCFTLKLLNT